MPLALAVLGLFALAAVLSGFCAKLAAEFWGDHLGSTRLRAGWLIGPLIIAVSLCTALLWPGLSHPSCHCIAHGLHHPHLCLRHPDFAVAVAFPAALVGLAWSSRAAPALGRLFAEWRETLRWGERIARAPELTLDGVKFRLVESLGVGACTIGLFDPKVAVDASVWRALNDEERRAVLHHEDAHRARRDPLTLLVLEACARFISLSGVVNLLNAWRAGAEHECDRHAAEVVGSPESIASALLTLERYYRSRPEASLALQARASGASLAARVRVLLSDDLRRERPSLGCDVLAVSLGGLVFAFAFTIFAGDLVHHAAETALGLLVHHH
jgi:Zn-dependent protease with chaperone function